MGIKQRYNTIFKTRQKRRGKIQMGAHMGGGGGKPDSGLKPNYRDSEIKFVPPPEAEPKSPSSVQCGLCIVAQQFPKHRARKGRGQIGSRKLTL